MVAVLQAMGHEVYDFKNPASRTGFSWSSVDENWQNWTTAEYRKALDHPIAKAGFNSDFDAMKWADCCVLVLPSGRSANVEAGWMKGAGKKVYVYKPVPMEAELMYKLFDGILISPADLQNTFAIKQQREILINIGSVVSSEEFKKVLTDIATRIDNNDNN